MRTLPLLLIISSLANTGLASGQDAKLTAGDHTRGLDVDGLKRSYIVHVPKSHDASKPTAVVLALHGAAMNGRMMVGFCGLNRTADREGFVAVYPSGTGIGPLQVWNAGGLPSKWSKADDVKYIGAVLDDLQGVLNVDRKRIYACGMSNGAMMCYRLASELSDRIAAIAPVAGTLAVKDPTPKRPVPLLHIHGTRDTFVPFEGATRKAFKVRFRSVDDSIQTWLKLNGCDKTDARTETLSKIDDAMKVTRTSYGDCKDNADVVLIVIDGGGHTWPGMRPPLDLLGPSAMNISANDLIWDFFKAHPMP